MTSISGIDRRFGSLLSRELNAARQEEVAGAKKTLDAAILNRRHDHGRKVRKPFWDTIITTVRSGSL